MFTISRLTGDLQPHLLTLFTLAASFDRAKNAKHHRKLEELLHLWRQHACCAPEHIRKLQEAIGLASTPNNGNLDHDNLPQEEDSKPRNISQINKEIPFVMPAMHGDQSISYYDLPAGNMMPLITPNSTRPILSHLVKPLQFVSGPAKESLANAVKSLLKDVEIMYTGVMDEGIVSDIDEMGQLMVKDQESGEFATIDSYYGWSVNFCERMKKRKEAAKQPNNEGTRRSLSVSDDEKLNPYKRQRRSASPGRGRDRSRSKDRRRPYERSRSRSRSAHNEYRNGFKRARSRSNSSSHSPPGHRYQRSVSPANPPRLSALPLPSSHFASFHNAGPPLQTPAAQIDNPFPSQPPPAPVAPPSSAFNHDFLMGPGGLPIPPPPPFHTGPWPPPPPNMPPALNFNLAQFSNHPAIGFVPPPPPLLHTGSGLGGPSPFGNTSAYNSGQQQWQSQGFGGGGQTEWNQQNEGRRDGGQGPWICGDNGRRGSGQGQWNQRNDGRGGGAPGQQRNQGNEGRGGQGQWNYREQSGRGGSGNWNQGHEGRRRW